MSLDVSTNRNYIRRTFDITFVSCFTDMPNKNKNIKFQLDYLQTQVEVIFLKKIEDLLILDDFNIIFKPLTTLKIVSKNQSITKTWQS